MKHFSKKTLAMAMAALMCIGTLAACASDADTPDTPTTTASTVTGDVTTEPAETEPPRITPNLPAANFEGHKFTVLTRGQSDATWYSRDIYAENLTGDTISDAVYKRNAKIEEQYGFEVVEVGSSDPATQAKNSIMAQNDEYDMICIRLKDHITGLITQGYLLDLNEVDLLDLSQPYYDQSAMESLSIANKLYAITGDLLTMDNDATRCTVFNKELFDALQLSDKIGGSLYDAVNNGKWTLDMLNLCCQAAVADLNGDQQMTNEDDQWGMCTEVFNTLAFYNSSGLFLFEKDENDVPVFQANTDQSITALQRIIPMMNAEYSLFYSNGVAEAIPNFKAGRILFHPAQLATFTAHYRDMEIDFGIIPLPKYTAEQQHYYSPVTSFGSNCISIPITASNLDRTATIIEALSCESMYSIL